MSQHQAPGSAAFQPFPLSLPISSFSTSTRSNHAGKPLWEHVACKGDSCVRFDKINFTAGPATVNAVVSYPVFKVVVDGAVHEQISLDHLARLASIDARNGAEGNDNAAKLNLVVKNPLLALKYVSEQFEIRRFQVKFCTGGEGGFTSALDNLRLFGLIARESDQSAKSKTSVQAAPASIAPISTNMSTSADNLAAGSQLHGSPIYQPIAAGLPLASTQTQGQRIEVPCYPSQDIAQPHSIPIYDFTHQSQKRYPSLQPPSFQTPVMSTFAREAPGMSSALPVKEGTHSPAFYPGLTDRLTDKPVGRRLSFTTPPSSGQQFPGSAQTDRFETQSADHSPSLSRPHVGSNVLSLPGLQPSLLARTANGAVPTERRPFFQRSSPLRNEVISTPHQSGPLIPELSLGVSHDTEFERPSTAPAYPGLLQANVTPPKRKLPFTSPNRTKNSSAAGSQDAEDAEEAITKAKAKTKAKGKATQKRPSTSPGDSDKAKSPVDKKRKPVKKAKTTATKKGQSKTTKVLDDATNLRVELSKTTAPPPSIEDWSTPESAGKQESIMGIPRISITRSYHSAATQTSILALNIPSTQVAKAPAVLSEVQRELHARGPQLVLLSSLMQTVDRIVLGSDVTKAVEPNEKREKAFEQKLCELLTDDKFLDLCDEVEKGASRIGAIV